LRNKSGVDLARELLYIYGNRLARELFAKFGEFNHQQVKLFRDTFIKLISIEDIDSVALAPTVDFEQMQYFLSQINRIQKENHLSLTFFDNEGDVGFFNFSSVPILIQSQLMKALMYYVGQNNQIPIEELRNKSGVDLARELLYIYGNRLARELFAKFGEFNHQQVKLFRDTFIKLISIEDIDSVALAPTVDFKQMQYFLGEMDRIQEENHLYVSFPDNEGDVGSFNFSSVPILINLSS
jgi:hypothetical protein